MSGGMLAASLRPWKKHKREYEIMLGKMTFPGRQTDTFFIFTGPRTSFLKERKSMYVQLLRFPVSMKADG